MAEIIRNRDEAEKFAKNAKFGAAYVIDVFPEPDGEDGIPTEEHFKQRDELVEIINKIMADPDTKDPRSENASDRAREAT